MERVNVIEICGIVRETSTCAIVHTLFFNFFHSEKFPLCRVARSWNERKEGRQASRRGVVQVSLINANLSFIYTTRRGGRNDEKKMSPLRLPFFL